MKKILTSILVLLLCASVAQAYDSIGLMCSKVRSATFGGITVDVYSVVADCNDPYDRFAGIGGGFYGDANVTQMVNIKPYLYDSDGNPGYRASPTLTVYTDPQYYKDEEHTIPANITGDVKDIDSHWSFTTAQFIPQITAPDETWTGSFITTVSDNGYSGRLYRDLSLTVTSALALEVQANTIEIAQIALVHGQTATFIGTLGTNTGSMTGYGLTDFSWYGSDFPPFIVPEPATISLLGLGALALLRRRSV